MHASSLLLGFLLARAATSSSLNSTERPGRSDSDTGRPDREGGLGLGRELGLGRGRGRDRDPERPFRLVRGSDVSGFHKYRTTSFSNLSSTPQVATVTVTVTLTETASASASAGPQASSRPGSDNEQPGNAGNATDTNLPTSIQAAADLAAAEDIDIGECPNIALAFGQNLEGRTETSFIPANLEQFPHGSAQNPNIITEFICDNLVNRCGLERQDAGVALCDEAAAAVAKLPRDGSAADAFNQFFGIVTNFGVIPVVDNQGKVVKPSV